MKRTWSICDGHVLVTAVPSGCGCDIHYVRTRLSALIDWTLAEVVREMTYAMDKGERDGCPYLKS